MVDEQTQPDIIRSPQWRRKVRNGLPTTVDLLTICMESGLGFNAAIQKIGQVTEQLAPEISAEFKIMERDIREGIPRADALGRFANRIDMDEVRSFCTILGQCETVGTSVSETLRTFASDMRLRRRQRAEMMAKGASSIIFLLPLFLFGFIPVALIIGFPLLFKVMGMIDLMNPETMQIPDIPDPFEGIDTTPKK